MRQRGRPRRSSMPAVAHNKISDCPYSRQHQSPPDEQCQRQQYYFNSGGPDSGEEEEDESESQQLSDHYSRIQLIDNWPPFMHHSQFPIDTASSSQKEQQQFFNQEDEQNLLAIDPEFMNYYYIQKFEDAQQSQDDDDDEQLEGPTGSKRKRAFSSSSLASTTNMMTTSNNNIVMSNMPTTSDNTMNGTGQTGEKRAATKICRVCGDKAYSYNFNVITCESCKAFFRRNANKEKEIRCPFNEQCDINIVSRRFCQRCRLQKCFRVGMKKEWIMSDEARLEKKQRIQENRERRAAAAIASELDLTPQEIKTVQQQQTLMMAEAEIQQPQLQTNKEENTFLLASGAATGSFTEFIQAGVIAQQQQQGKENHNHELQQAAMEVMSALPTQQQHQSASLLASNTPNTVSSVEPIPMMITPNTDSAPTTAVLAPTAAAVAAAFIQQQNTQQIMGATIPATNETAAIVEQQANAAAANAVIQQQIASQVVAHQVQQLAEHHHQQQQQQAVAAAAAVAQLQQQAQAQQHQSTSLLASNTLNTVSSVEPIPMMITPNTDNAPITAVLAPTAAAVAAAFIQQQNTQQIMGATIPATNETAAIVEQQANAAAAANAVIQQQIASQVVAHQVQQLAEHHHQQQAVAAAAAVAQLQQQAQAQQQAAQIVAHAQQMVQQQQLAAFANAAAIHHHAQQTATASLLAGNSQPTNSVETVNQQLQQVANSLNATGTINSSDGSPASSATAAQSVLPTIIEVAAKLAAQPVSQAPISQTSQPTATANTLLPTLVPASAQVAAAATANLMIQQQQQQLNMNDTSQSSAVNQSVASIGLINSLNSAVPLPQQSLPATGDITSNVQSQQQQPNCQQEMVSVPKDMLIKLVEQRLEAERNHLQTPSKCQCHCQCGRYPNEMLIVDKVMADLLESSSKHLNNAETQSSNNSTPRLSQQFTASHFQTVNGQQNWIPPQQTALAAIEVMDTNTNNTIYQVSSNVRKLTTADQEQLAELSKANEFWKSSSPTIATNSGAINTSEIQFLLGHYTESDLRRLITLAKSLEAFKRLDQQDQERLLKGCFGSFFVLRSLLKVDPANEYTLTIMRQNGVPEHIIKFYTDFPSEWQHNETINILLGLQLLFNVEVSGLQSAISVTVENMKFQSLLKRLLYILCDQDVIRADAAYNELIMQVEQLKKLFPAVNNIGQQNVTSIPIGIMAFGQQPQIDSLNLTATNNSCKQFQHQ